MTRKKRCSEEVFKKGGLSLEKERWEEMRDHCIMTGESYDSFIANTIREFIAGDLLTLEIGVLQDTYRLQTSVVGCRLKQSYMIEPSYYELMRNVARKFKISLNELVGILVKAKLDGVSVTLETLRKYHEEVM